MEEKKETPANPIRYYKKELISNRLALPNGRAIVFEQVGGTDTGVLSTIDQGLISELDKAIAARRGGLISISQQQYEDLKKNPPAGRSRIRSLNAQSLRQLLTTSQRPVAAQAAAVVHEPSAPMEVPKGVATISSRKKLKELTERAMQQAVGA